MQGEMILAGYIVAFAFVHSLMAATSFKKKAYEVMDSSLYRLLYTLVSVLTVLPILYMWLIFRAGSPVLYSFDLPFALVSVVMLVTGSFLIVSSFRAIDLLGFIGLKRFSNRDVGGEQDGLVKSGVYGFVRHPLYLGGMLILWSNPVMRLVDFIVALFFSLYFVVGGVLEERKLENEFGSEYKRYKRDVSMFLPLKWIKRRFF